jgi:hypothetical protein
LRYIVPSDIPSRISSISRPLRATWPTIIPELLAYVALLEFTTVFSHPAIYTPLATWLESINDATTLTLYRVVLG